MKKSNDINQETKPKIGTENPKQKIEHLNKVKKNPWIYIMVIASGLFYALILRA